MRRVGQPIVAVGRLVALLLLGVAFGADAQPQDEPPLEPAPAAAPAPEPVPNGAGAPSEDAIVLNFEGADIREVVHSLASALEINYLIDPRVEGQVTIRTTGKIPRSELFPIFNQVLRSIGIAAVKVGEVYNIVPIADAKTRVNVKRSALGQMTQDDMFVIEIVQVQNVAAEEMANLLQPFITPGGDVFPYARANFLVITDLASNVDRLREMIQLLDRDSFKALKARVYKIENANIEDLGQELIAVLDTYGITGEAANERGVYAIPLVRLNSIAVLAFNEDAFQAVDYWMKLLDVPPDDDATRTVRVYNLQNSKAADLAQILNELYGGNGSESQTGQQGAQQGPGGLFGRATGGRLGGGGGAASRAASQSLGALGGTAQSSSRSSRSGSSGFNSGGNGSGGGGGFQRGGGAQPAGVLGGAPGGGLRGGAGATSVVLAGGQGPLSFFREEVRIVADEISNSLVILATKRDYEQILKVLHDLDRVPRQVVIEVLVAEVRLNKNMELGIAGVVANANVGGVPTPPGPTATPNPTNSTGELLGNVLQTIPGGDLKRFIQSSFLNAPGAFTALITDKNTFVAEIQARAAAGRAKILASPHLLTADNREASINIGQSIPVLTSQANVPGVQGVGGQTALVNNVQYRDTGVILNILPQVNAEGLVNLQVRQEVSAVDATFQSSTGSPAFIVREAETTAVVQDGDSLLIGGIIQEDTQRSRSGVPYLMDLPVLGQLFRFENTQTNRVELIIMLTPHVIRSRAEALETTQEYKDRLWDVLDEIERTKGLHPTGGVERMKVERLRARSTTAERPVEGLLPNRAWED